MKRSWKLNYGYRVSGIRARWRGKKASVKFYTLCYERWILFRHSERKKLWALHPYRSLDQIALAGRRCISVGPDGCDLLKFGVTVNTRRYQQELNWTVWVKYDQHIKRDYRRQLRFMIQQKWFMAHWKHWVGKFYLMPLTNQTWLFPINTCLQISVRH